MSMKTHCDICGKTIIDKFNPDGEASGASYMRFRYGLLGEGKDIRFDICDNCMNEIKKRINGDTAKIVRCKDCHWYGTDGCTMHPHNEEYNMREQDYCSYGERAKE